MLSSGGEANEGLRPAGLPHRRAPPLLIVLLIPLLACLGTATAAQGRYGLRGPAPSRALAADGRRLAATDAPTSVAEGGNATATEGGNDKKKECYRRRDESTVFSILFWFSAYSSFLCWAKSTKALSCFLGFSSCISSSSGISSSEDVIQLGFSLYSIEMNVYRICVLGSTGSGKSSFLRLFCKALDS